MDIRNEIERKEKEDTSSLKMFECYVKEQITSEIQFRSTLDTDNFFDAIRPHYSFLNCSLIIGLTRFLSESVRLKAEVYKHENKQFKKETKVVELRKTLEPYYNSYRMGTSIKVIITLEYIWEEQEMCIVEELVKSFFRLKHADNCQWFSVEPGSVVVTFLAPKHLKQRLIENSEKSTQFMNLIGVVSLQVQDHFVFKGEESIMFSFENSLIQATVDNNIEVVKFLLQHLKVDVNAKTDQPIYRNIPDEIFITESEVTEELEDFKTTFSELTNDIEDQLQNASKHGKANSEHIIQAIKASNNFFDCQKFLNLAYPLTDHLNQKRNYFSKRIEWFKKETKLSLFHGRLDKYFQSENTENVHITLVLENVWSMCSMWFVEQLLQLLFSSTHFNEFHSFMVSINESVSMVFLTKRQFITSLIKHSQNKVQLMELTGVISLSIGDTVVYTTKRKHDYKFDKSISLAKISGNSEALELLLQVFQAPIATYIISKLDHNKNYHLFPDPDSTALMIACCNDSTEMVKLLLESGKADPNIQNGRKYTALMYACRNNTICQLLINNRADVDKLNIFTETALFWASYVGNTKAVKTLLPLVSPDIIVIQSHSGYTPLHIASQEGHIGVVEQLLKAKADPNIPSINRETPIYVASYNGHSQIVQRFLQEQVDPNIADDVGITPLYIASQEGKLDIVEQLLQAKADPNIPANNGETPLCAASYSGHLLIVQRLLQEQVDPNIADDEGITPLYIASQEGKLNIVEQLLQAKADPNIPANSGETPLFAASYNGHSQIVQRLLQEQVNPSIANDEGITPLHIASLECKMDVVEQLLQAKADPNIPNNNGRTPLYAASYNGHSQIVERLLQEQINPNIADNLGITPLYIASKEGKLDAVEHLLQAKSDPNIPANNGKTPLYAASYNGHSQIVQRLLQEQVDPNIADNDGITPLYIASLEGEMDIVEHLLQAKADPNIPANNGKTPLYAASYNGHSQIVQRLLQEQVDPNIADNDGITPLYIASLEGEMDVVEQLLQAKADPNIPANNGKTPLYAASYNGHSQIVQQLLQEQVDPNIADDDGITPLYIASLQDEIDVVEQLLQAKADPNIPANNGKTPLYAASYNGHSQIVQQLLQEQVDPNIADDKGITPLYIASLQGELDAVEQLLQAKADANIPANNGETPLHAASYSGHLQIVQRLLQEHVDPNIADNEGVTPLYLASQDGRMDVVEQLLQAKADPNIPTNNGITPLCIASYTDHMKIVEKFLQEQVDRNTLSYEDITQYSSQDGWMNVVERLFKATVDPNIPANNTKTLFFLYSYISHLQLVQQLLQERLDLNNIASDEDITPLTIASQESRRDVVEKLLKAGADPNIASDEGITPLYLASQDGTMDIVEKLLQAGADPNIPVNGRTPLHAACFMGHLQVARLLQTWQANVNAQYKSGPTPIHIACLQGHSDIVEWLLQVKADITIRSNNGKTPLDIAIEKGHSQIVEMLLKA